MQKPGTPVGAARDRDLLRLRRGRRREHLGAGVAREPHYRDQPGRDSNSHTDRHQRSPPFRHALFMRDVIRSQTIRKINLGLRAGQQSTPPRSLPTMPVGKK